MRQQEEEQKFEEEVSTLFHRLEISTPRKSLLIDLFKTINRRQLFWLRTKLATICLFVISFSAGSIFFAKTIFLQIAQSETLSLLSLAFSDFNIVVTNWKEYSLFFLESLPVVSILFLLAGMFLLLLSIKIIVQELSAKHHLLIHK